MVAVTASAPSSGCGRRRHLGRADTTTSASTTCTQLPQLEHAPHIGWRPGPLDPSSRCPSIPVEPTGPGPAPHQHGWQPGQAPEGVPGARTKPKVAKKAAAPINQPREMRPIVLLKPWPAYGLQVRWQSVSRGFCAACSTRDAPVIFVRFLLGYSSALITADATCCQSLHLIQMLRSVSTCTNGCSCWSARREEYPLAFPYHGSLYRLS